MREHRVRPTFSDVLFIRDTKPFGLSSNAGKAGFAVSFAFETASKRTLARIEQALAALADKLTDPRYDGRVYLVKNVYASQETLRAMYGEHAIGLLKVKRELRPRSPAGQRLLRAHVRGPLRRGLRRSARRSHRCRS